MRRFSFKALALFAAALLLAAHPAQAALKVGAEAPEFILTGGDGATYTLEQFKGKIVVLEWFNQECPFVKMHYQPGITQALQSKYTGKGVVWLNVISSAEGKQGYLTQEQVPDAVKNNNIRSTAVLLDADGKVGRSYGATNTPHFFIIGKDGKLAYEGAQDNLPDLKSGDVKEAESYVSKALDELLAGKPVTNSAVKPYGCNVKY